ncbi:MULTISPECIES: phospholipase D family protein [unclassified Bradyrhizobium]|uniref:phospholipase D family protein n=1 Tax=unclassified Bradyrhizobium TaxID=2631580 RepID=UPI002FEFD0C8
MSFDQESSYSLFDVLKPDVDAVVTNAAVATYSLDLVTLLGLVLALGGKADEEFETGPVGLIDAFRKMSGRLKVLCQKSRIVVPKRHHAILIVLDGMIRQISTNQRMASWHPKFAFVRYLKEGKVTWRFWIGSRNLTGSRDLEAGLLLIGRLDGGRGGQMAGMADLIDGLLTPDDMPGAVIEELKEVRWQAPRGVKVVRIHWRQAGTVRPFLSEASRKRRTIAISPFVDREGISQALAFAGGDSIGILTTEESASKLTYPDEMDIRVMAPPEPLGLDSSETPVETAQAEFEDFVPARGLHAKLILQSRGTKAVLFIGSANLTRRGLNGPNAEVTAELELSDPKIQEALVNYFACQSRASLQDTEEPGHDPAQRALDEDVSDLANLEFRLDIGQSSAVLNVNGDLDEFLSRNLLTVELFSLPATKVHWPSNSRALVICQSELPIKSRTSFVVFEATSRSDPSVSRLWTQLVACSGFEPEIRDRAAIAAYVGVGRFKDWFRATLEGVVPAEAERWTGEPNPNTGSRPASAFDSGFSLEHVLTRWARNPQEFERRVPDVSSMIVAFREEIESGPPGAERETASRELAEIEKFWAAVTEALSAETL